MSGKDRYETPVSIARKLKEKLGTLGGTAIIATGANYPDALAISSLVANKGMPILLVKKDLIPSSAQTALIELGITKTIIV